MRLPRWQLLQCLDLSISSLGLQLGRRLYCLDAQTNGIAGPTSGWLIRVPFWFTYFIIISITICHDLSCILTIASKLYALGISCITTIS